MSCFCYNFLSSKSEFTDYGQTPAKSLDLCSTNSYPNYPNPFKMSWKLSFFVEIMVDFWKIMSYGPVTTQWQNVYLKYPTIYLGHLPKSAIFFGYSWKKKLFTCPLSMPELIKNICNVNSFFELKFSSYILEFMYLALIVTI